MQDGEHGSHVTKVEMEMDRQRYKERGKLYHNKLLYTGYQKEEKLEEQNKGSKC